MLVVCRIETRGHGRGMVVASSAPLSQAILVES